MKNATQLKALIIYYLGLFFSLFIYVLVCLFLGYTSLKSQTKYVVSSDKLVINLSKEIALKQIGEMEIKQNYSPQIMEYLNSVGLNSPNPYCAAGQYYSFKIAVESLNKLYPKHHFKIPIYKTASTRLMFNKAKENGKNTKYLAAENDLIFWKRDNSYFGHTERVYKVEKVKLSNKIIQTGWLQTIAFNTECGTKKIDNLNGKTNTKVKEGVCLKRRNIYHILGRLSLLGLIGFDTNNQQNKL